MSKTTQERKNVQALYDYLVKQNVTDGKVSLHLSAYHQTVLNVLMNANGAITLRELRKRSGYTSAEVGARWMARMGLPIFITPSGKRGPWLYRYDASKQAVKPV